MRCAGAQVARGGGRGVRAVQRPMPHRPAGNALAVNAVAEVPRHVAVAGLLHVLELDHTHRAAVEVLVVQQCDALLQGGGGLELHGAAAAGEVCLLIHI